jgi:hypothetical protein
LGAHLILESPFQSEIQAVVLIGLVEERPFMAALCELWSRRASVRRVRAPAPYGFRAGGARARVQKQRVLRRRVGRVSGRGARIGGGSRIRSCGSGRDGLGGNYFGFWRPHKLPGFAVRLEGRPLRPRRDTNDLAIFY